MRSYISFPFAATAALLAGTIYVSNLTARRIPEPLVRPLQEISPSLEGWNTMGEHTLDARVLKSLVPTDYLSRTYRKGNFDLDLFIAFYAQQRAGESMHSPKHCLPGAGWEIWQHGSAMVPANGGQVEINKYSIQSAGTRMLMFYWYQSKGRIIANEYLGKILLARDTLLTASTGGSIVRIIVMDTPGIEPHAIAFATKLIPEIQRCFGSDPLAAR
jgi:EpsI family protein